MSFKILKSRWHIYVSVFVIGLFVILVSLNRYAPKQKTLPADIEFSYHSIEQHGDNYYLIRGFKEFNNMNNFNNYYRELWRYDKKSFQGEKLFGSKSIDFRDFRVNPAENYIALYTGLNNLKILDLNNKQIIFKHESDLELYWEDWSSDGQSFWFTGVISGPGLGHLFKLNSADWQITDYDLTNLKISEEFDLNPDTAMLVYSDYPATFDFPSGIQIMNEKPQINLYLYDLNNKTNRILTRQRTGRLLPKWLNNQTVEYTEYPPLTDEMNQLLEELKTKQNFSSEDMYRMADVVEEWEQGKKREKISIE